MMQRFLLVALAACWLTTSAARADTVQLVEQHLQAGTLSAGETALQKVLKEHPQDDQARLGMATIQFLRTFEGLSHAIYRHGVMQRRLWILQFAGNVETPAERNPNPEPITGEKFRKIFLDFLSGLERTEATLAQIKSPDVKLPLHFGLIRLDLDGDGKTSDDDRLWRLYARTAGANEIRQQDAEKFVITFDLGDVYWLRGYCHLLMGLTESFLAYDMHELIERAGHLVFPKVESPYPFLEEDYVGRNRDQFWFFEIADLIAYIHLLNFPLAEKERMPSALKHMEMVVQLSRESWKAILAETDDDHEWLPSPKQTGVIPGVQVTQEMIDAWHDTLAETELILQGKKLVPFWRGTERRGINIRKIFTEPRAFDLVLWIQGTGAAPYIEEGPLTTPDNWQRPWRVFGGQFFGFALWFN